MYIFDIYSLIIDNISIIIGYDIDCFHTFLVRMQRVIANSDSHI